MYIGVRDVYARGMRMGLVVTVGLVAAVLGTGPAAHAVTVSTQVAASDGVKLQTTLTTTDPAAKRPTIVEFTPYGRGGASFDGGSAFHHLLVQVRGTGDSHGRFDAFGPRMQRDLQDVLGWACRQPWSDGALGLAGFSASAIAVYNSLHLPLPCVKTAVLKSGTFELYRDLLVPGGVNNLVPGTVVLAGIGLLALSQGADRDPATAPDAVLGQLGTGLQDVTRPTQDTWWRERGFRGDVNHLPILVVNGFFDVESRGAFEGYQQLKGDGAHLLVVGAHDAAPKGTDGGLPTQRAWFDRHLRGIDNGVDRQPRVQLLLSDGSRRAYVQGRFVRRDATDWPVPGTRWRALHLDGADRLTETRPATSTTQAYATVPSLVTATDVPNAAIVDGAGASALTDELPALGDMRLAEPLGRAWTTPPLTEDVVSVGPGSLEVTAATTSPGSALWAVVSDVDLEGVAHPLTVGRLNTSFPLVDQVRSRRDPVTGDVVQPYGRFDLRRTAVPGIAQRYQIELWPLGNRFKRGHRIRVHLVGASAASPLAPPGVTTVTTGGAQPSRLLLPVLPAG